MGAKLTHDKFIENVKSKNKYVARGDVDILGKYINISQKIECRCNIHDVIWYPFAGSLYKGIGCSKCGAEKTSVQKMKSHEDFLKEVYEFNQSVIVHGIYAGAYSELEFEYQCGHRWKIAPNVFLHNSHECPYCLGQRVLVGFNDLWTTAPETARLLTNPNDGYKFTRGSGKKANFTCPLCNNSQDKFIKNVVNRGLQCLYCGDSISYPNKFGRELLNQLQVISHKPEYQPKWAKPYFYDNYFEYDNHKYILEMDGSFHYSEYNGFGKSLQERLESDYIKDELAKIHNIIMIRIDCRESNCDYIKNNIISSQLNDIFDLSIIDWKRCDAQAHKNLVKAACDLFENEDKSFLEISNILKIGKSTARSYINKGNKLGWCSYDSKKYKRNRSNNTKLM